MTLIIVIVLLVISLIFNVISLIADKKFTKSYHEALEVIQRYESGEIYKILATENQKLKDENDYLNTLVFAFERKFDPENWIN